MRQSAAHAAVAAILLLAGVAAAYEQASGSAILVEGGAFSTDAEYTFISPVSVTIRGASFASPSGGLRITLRAPAVAFENITFAAAAKILLDAPRGSAIARGLTGTHGDVQGVLELRGDACEATMVRTTATSITAPSAPIRLFCGPKAPVFSGNTVFTTISGLTTLSAPGCDGAVGSTKLLDACLVCGGDGSSCAVEEAAAEAAPEAPAGPAVSDSTAPAEAANTPALSEANTAGAEDEITGGNSDLLLAAFGITLVCMLTAGIWIFVARRRHGKETEAD